MADLPGRAQIVSDPDICTQNMNSGPGGLVFYLDGAHSPESLEVCARWFSNVIREETQSERESPESCKYKQAGRLPHLISMQMLSFRCSLCTLSR